jgi:hypothetical protein
MVAAKGIGECRNTHRAVRYVYFTFLSPLHSHMRERNYTASAPFVERRAFLLGFIEKFLGGVVAKHLEILYL